MQRFAILMFRIFLFALFISAGTAMVGASVYLYIHPKLPPVETLRDVRLQTPLRIYSADGLLIGEYGEKRRNPVHISQVPEHMVKAVLAAEDDRFYQHPGVDIAGLVRAAAQLIASGEIRTGGSTITMQVAKNYFLTTDRTFARKFSEILLALEIESELSKNDILELYLNKIFLGNQAYGVAAAAQVYYGANISELTLAQMAMIAGLPKAPSAYNPLANASRALERRNWILGRMYNLGYITQAEYQSATAEPITAEYHGTQLQSDAAYVAEEARQYAINTYGGKVYTEGYRIYTSIDSKLQRAANKAVIEGIAEYDRRHGYRGPEDQWQLPAGILEGEEREQWLDKLNELRPIAIWHPALVVGVQDKSLELLLRDGSEVTLEWEQGLSETRPYLNVNAMGPKPDSADDLAARGDIVRIYKNEEGVWQFGQVPDAQAALISLNADTGAILAMVGGFDYRHSSFNRAMQAKRQPGSNFKPFIYTAALEHGFTAASIINDAPIVFDDKALEATWRPTNASGKFDGPTRLRKALYRSRNLVSIRLLRQLGFRKAIDYAGKFGFNTSELPRDLSLALGSHSVTLLDVVTGYAVFANGGYKVQPWMIHRVEDRDGTLLYQANPPLVCHDCEPGETPPPLDPAMEDHMTIEDILAQKDSEVLEPKLAKRVVEERVAYIIDDILKDVIRRGTGRKALVLERGDIAGKTGTTNGPTDAWFSGYGGGVVTTTWAGFDQNDNLGTREYGGSVALPMWIDYMREALADRPERNFRQPAGMVSVRIDPETGLLARANQSDAIFEMFRSEHAPTEKAEQDSERSIDVFESDTLEEIDSSSYDEPVQLF